MTFRRYSLWITCYRRYCNISPSATTGRNTSWKRLVSTSASAAAVVASTAKKITPKSVKNGGWVLLAALEKAKEADGIKIAKLLSSLETLVPRIRIKEEKTDMIQQLKTTTVTNQHQKPPPTTRRSRLPHSTDPAFFSLPNLIVHDNNDDDDYDTIINDYNKIRITSEDVAALLQATRRGRRIDTYTIETILQGATNYMQNTVTNAVVTLPPLQQHRHRQQQQQLTVIGDLHGSLSDLEAVLGLTGEPSQNNLLLFNGDFADRGDHGIEVIVIICALVLAFPGRVYCNRGNHEDVTMSMMYGLSEEIQHKYGATTFPNQLGTLLDEFFKSLPLATVIEKDAMIVHGGPPPPGITLDILRQHQQQQRQRPPIIDQNGDNCNNNHLKSPWYSLSRTVRSNMGTKNAFGVNNEQESSSLPTLDDEEVIESLLWSDPDINEEFGSLENDSISNIDDKNRKHLASWRPNLSRGAGYKFDAVAVRNVLQAEGLYRMVRSHEPVHNGCERYVVHEGPTTNDNHGKQVSIMEFFTVFSASRYPAKEGFNRGAVLKLQPNLKHEIIRYVTEDDEPISAWKVAEQQKTAIAEEEQEFHKDEVDIATLRRTLTEVLATRRSALKRSLEKEVAASSSRKSKVDDICLYDMPFNQAVDILVRTLHLEGEGLSQPGPRLALARALLFTEGEEYTLDVPPKTIKLLPALDACAAVQDENDNYVYNNCSPLQRTWLKAVFTLIDANHDGVVTKSEWMAAIKTVNDKLSDISNDSSIDAEDTWKLLDITDDGYISVSDWNILGTEMCR